jgi:hypothetical protein
MSSPIQRLRTLPRFAVLYDHYPEVDHPCDGGWENQCAIRMSICLLGSGFHFVNYRDPICQHGHARGAESLANYLWRQVGRPRISTTSGAGRAWALERRGIVLFRNISGFRGGRGDHIDLWDRTEAMTGEYFDRAAETWFWNVGG